MGLVPDWEEGRALLLQWTYFEIGLSLNSALTKLDSGDNSALGVPYVTSSPLPVPPSQFSLLRMCVANFMLGHLALPSLHSSLLL